MPRSHPPLNDIQLKVLRWIADGCPDGIMTGHSFKISAVALRNRKLVTLSKRGGVWEAAATPAGKHYLDTGTYEPSKSEEPSSTAPSARAPSRTRKARHVPALREGTDSPRRSSPTDLFIGELAEKGQVEVGPHVARRYEQYMKAAIRYNKLPYGKQFATEGSRWSGSFVIRLEDAPAWMFAHLHPIPVPATLRNPHPAVAQLQAGGTLAGIGKKVEHRVLVLLQAMAAEAQRRGYACDALRRPTHRGDRRADSGHIAITVRSCSVTVEVKQVKDRKSHVPTDSELALAANYPNQSIRKYDYEPGNRLSLHLSGGMEHRRSVWGDGKARRLEGVLTVSTYTPP